MRVPSWMIVVGLFVWVGATMVCSGVAFWGVRTAQIQTFEAGFSLFDVSSDVLLDHGVLISMSDKGEPTQNGLVERFMRRTCRLHRISGLRGCSDAIEALA